MHKEYIKTNNSIIVLDRNGKKIEYDCQNNIVEEILKKENLLEKMNIEENRLKEMLKMQGKPFDPKFYILFGTLEVSFVMWFLNQVSNSIPVNTPFGTFNSNTILLAVLIPAATLEMLSFYNKDIQSIRNVKGLEKEVEYLKTIIQKEQTELEKLQQGIKTREIESNPIDIKTELIKLKEELNKCYNTEYNNIKEEEKNKLTKKLI